MRGMAKNFFYQGKLWACTVKKQNIQTCHSYGHTELNLVYEAYLKIQSGAWERLPGKF